MTDMISEKNIEELAEKLAIDLTAEEKVKFATELSKMLEGLKEFASLDIPTEIAEKKESSNLNLMRADEVTNSPGEFTEDILKEMPEVEGSSLKIHKILGGDE